VGGGQQVAHRADRLLRQRDHQLLHTHGRATRPGRFALGPVQQRQKRGRQVRQRFLTARQAA
jgi:hypothetical protein